MFFTVLFIIIILLIVWVVKTYNKLQSYMQSIREQLSNLQAGIKQRTDLSNQIVEIAQGYGDHEKIAHLSVTQGNKAMESMRALAQSYPDLKANQTYQTLMQQLERLEDSILQRRESYNSHVKRYNSYRNNVPTVFIAQRLSFSVAPYYEIEDPNFMEKIKVFERDDTETLQELIATSSQSVNHTIQNSKEKIQSQVHEFQAHKKDKETD